MKIKSMTYTKDNGDTSKRVIAVVTEPRDNYLCYDITDFTEDELEMFRLYTTSIEVFRDETLNEFEEVTGKKIDKLWRSFKPIGIKWDDEYN